MKEQLLSDGDRAALQSLIPYAGALGAGPDLRPPEARGPRGLRNLRDGSVGSTAYLSIEGGLRDHDLSSNEDGLFDVTALELFDS